MYSDMSLLRHMPPRDARGVQSSMDYNDLEMHSDGMGGIFLFLLA